ncbi:hypothetical protein [Paenibacillus taichungensis]
MNHIDEHTDYDFLIECVRSGMVDGESFSEAIANFDNFREDTDPKVNDILSTINKSQDDLKSDVRKWLDTDSWRD